MLELRDVGKKFEGVTVLEHINLQFETGNYYALVGKSGSGKSTLLNILAKLETYEGVILFDRSDFKTIHSSDYYRNTMGYLFQNFGLIDYETVAFNLDLAFGGRKMKKKTREAEEKAVLARVGLSYINLTDKIYTLSGGEAQRVAIARLLLKKPKIILADEPTASLDEETAEEVLKLILELKNESTLLIIATHSPKVWQYADVCIDVTQFHK